METNGNMVDGSFCIYCNAYSRGGAQLACDFTDAAEFRLISSIPKLGVLCRALDIVTTSMSPIRCTRPQDYGQITLPGLKKREGNNMAEVS